jgi:hypothetical protein
MALLLAEGNSVVKKKYLYIILDILHAFLLKYVWVLFLSNNIEISV